jgi:hypothetical protein
MAIDFMGADIAKDVDSFSVGVFFDVEGKDVLESDVSFPNVGVPLHLSDTQ